MGVVGQDYTSKIALQQAYGSQGLRLRGLAVATTDTHSRCVSWENNRRPGPPRGLPHYPGLRLIWRSPRGEERRVDAEL
jgi:hypothetical protein